MSRAISWQARLRGWWAEPSLGTAASGNAGARLKSKLKWSFQQSKKVETLEDTISVPLATINANIGMQIL